MNIFHRAHTGFRKETAFVIALCAALFGASALAAPLQNGGFETGTFSPWTTTASGVTVGGTTGGVAPQEGSFQAVINTPASGTVFQGGLESFLGLAGGTLSSYNNGGVGGGNAFAQSFDITNGQSITFKWDFLPNGNNVNAGQNDTAFYTLHLASDTSSSIVFTLSSTSASGGAATGYQTVTTGPLAAGTYLLGFGVNDQKVPAGAFNAQRPTLLVDAVSVIPEPTTLTLLSFGVVAGAAYLRRRRHS